MSLDELMQALSQLASYLLPVCGVIVLIYIVLLLKTLIETLKDLSLTLLTAQDELKKLDAPLQTIEDISHSVDHVHAAAKTMAADTAAAAVQGFDTVKDLLFNKDKAEKAEDETAQPSAPAPETAEGDQEDNHE
jgi:uncharacterized protein YoxC